MLYKDLFFDLDRTLWDLDSNSKEALFEIFTQYNLEQIGVFNFDAFFQNYQNINDKLWDDYRKGLVFKEDLRYNRFILTLDAFGIQDIALAKKIGDQYVETAPLRTKLLPNAMEVLHYLKSKYSLHIITNGFEEVQQLKMKNSGLSPFFNEIITSDRAKYKKPDPRIFAFALHQTGAKRNDSLMIGDNLQLDVIGAKNMGIAQVFFNPEGLRHECEVTYEIKDLSELIQFL
jgi:putative hydrolase of the HAD superfamily